MMFNAILPSITELIDPGYVMKFLLRKREYRKGYSFINSFDNN